MYQIQFDRLGFFERSRLMKRKAVFVIVALIAVLLMFVLMMTKDNEANETAEAQTYVFLVENGFAPIQACGIMANIALESNFDSNATSGKEEDLYGIMQWSYMKREHLEDYANILGKPVSDLETQLMFLVEEITYNTHARGNEWAEFWKANDPAKAAEIFSDLYIRPAVSPNNVLSVKAQEFYDEYKDVIIKN